MFLIKEDLGISLTWSKNIIRIILLKIPPQVIIRLFAIIVIKMVTWNLDVPWKGMHIMVSNAFGFQKEPLLTLKDPKSFGYLKLEIFSCRAWRRRKINGTWTAVVQGTWPETMHGSQASPKLKMVEKYLLETIQKEKFLELEMLVKFPQL